MNIDDTLINLVYVIAAVLFIVGLKFLGSPATARKGNLISAIGMLTAVVVTLGNQQILSFELIAVGVAVGTMVVSDWDSSKKSIVNEYCGVVFAASLWKTPSK